MSINTFSDIDRCNDVIISSHYYLTEIDDVQFRPAFIAVDNSEDAQLKENVIYTYNIILWYYDLQNNAEVLQACVDQLQPAQKAALYREMQNSWAPHCTIHPHPATSKPWLAVYTPMYCSLPPYSDPAIT